MPFWPTVLVAASVAAMANLGFWQLDRKEQKEALIARHRANSQLPPIAWPWVPPADDSLLYRRATGFCLQPVGWRAVAGRSAAGEPGWSHIVACRTSAEGPGMQVDMGWSKSSTPPAGWRGGEISGVIAPDQRHRIRLVSATPAPGLQASAPPSPRTGSSHLAYAIQWFFFAAAALVIYGLVLRKRLRDTNLPPPPPDPKSGGQ